MTYPVGTQLLAQLRSAVADGDLGPGDLFPSIRELAEATGVSVNTVRSAYARLENEGLVRTEHGRGTFVADERGTRRELRRQIERLEAAVARGPQRGTAASGAPAGRLLTTRSCAGCATRSAPRWRGWTPSGRADAAAAGTGPPRREPDPAEERPAAEDARIIDQPGQRAPALGRWLPRQSPCG